MKVRIGFNLSCRFGLPEISRVIFEIVIRSELRDERMVCI